MIRQPVVAGRFYPSNSQTLRRDVEGYTTPRPQSLVRAKACLVPHAGYMYSGAVAGAVFAALDLPDRVIILAPDHFGQGAEPFALHPASEWETPLGRAAVDTELAARIRMTAHDEQAHAEHSLEVQLPFLQVLRPDFKFVPIAIGAGDYQSLAAFGEALAAANTMIVASSDLNHYEDDRTTRRKDQMAIDHMLRLDAAGLLDTLRRERISMCGFGPAVAAITAAKLLGATEGKLIRHATSGDVKEGDRSRVVGYAGIVFV